MRVPFIYPWREWTFFFFLLPISAPGEGDREESIGVSALDEESGLEEAAGIFFLFVSFLSFLLRAESCWRSTRER